MKLLLKLVNLSIMTRQDRKHSYQKNNELVRSMHSEMYAIKLKVKHTKFLEFFVNGTQGHGPS